MGEIGTIYLLHLDRPFGHMKHYLGWTRNLEGRLYYHWNGNGAKVLKYVRNREIGWTLARTWQGDRDQERRLKGRGKAAICPICIYLKRMEESNAREAGQELEAVPQAAQEGHVEVPRSPDHQRLIQEAPQEEVIWSDCYPLTWGSYRKEA